MDFRKFGLLAACLAWPITAYDGKAAPARATNQAELLEKSSTGISPKTTSQPELAELELFKRVDGYTLPSDYCGWYGDYKSASYTCVMNSASCINIGDYRGCCNEPSLSCASTFYTTCIPNSKLTSSQTCGSKTMCCDGTDYPECGTILFTFSTDSDKTYTNIDCWSKGFGKTYRMQDYPPYLTSTSSTTDTTDTSTSSQPPVSTSSSSTTTSTTPSIGPTSTAADSGSGTPVGPIVGGVVGGVAVIGLVGLGIFFIMRRKKSHTPTPDPNVGGGQPPHTGTFPPQMGQVQQPMSPSMPSNSPGGSYVPPAYDPRYSYATPQQAQAYPMVSPDPNTGAFPGQPSPYPSPGPHSPDPVKMAGGYGYDPNTSPVQQPSQQPPAVVNEAPATNPVGIGNNRAELA